MMKSLATIDDVSLAILQCAYKDKLQQPNSWDAKSIDTLATEASAILQRRYKLSESVLLEGKNRVLLAKCFEHCHTFDGTGKVYHAQINAAGEDLMTRLEDRMTEEKKHNEIIRVAWVSAVISVVSALAAVGSAWYAKLQSDSSALSAQASAGSIAPQQKLPNQAQQDAAANP